LHYLPFEALVPAFEKEMPEYLIERANISYAPSASVYQFLSEKKKKHKQSVLIAFADPVFGKSKNEIAQFNDAYEKDIIRGMFKKNSFKFNRLKYSREEVNKISGHFPKTQTSLYLRKEASEENVKSGILNSCQIIHFAAYVNRICSNKITDWLRKNYSGKEDLADFQADSHKLIAPDQNALDKLIQYEEKNKLDRALKNLNVHEKKILYQHYYRTWSFEEIARFMNSKPETIRKTAERARKKIAKKFKIN